MTRQSKKKPQKTTYVYLIETKAVHSSAFPTLFYLTLVLSTGILNHLATVEPGVRRLQARVRFHQPPRFQIAKSWIRAWERGYHLQVSEIWRVSSVKKPERSYAGLMRSVIYFMRLLVSKYFLTFIRGCCRPGTRVDLQYKNPLIFHPCN